MTYHPNMQSLFGKRGPGAQLEEYQRCILLGCPPHARRAVRCINQVIHTLPSPSHRRMLIARYEHHAVDLPQAAARRGISQRAYRAALADASRAFAAAWPVAAERYAVAGGKLPPLPRPAGVPGVPGLPGLPTSQEVAEQ